MLTNNQSASILTFDLAQHASIQFKFYIRCDAFVQDQVNDSCAFARLPLCPYDLDKDGHQWGVITMAKYSQGQNVERIHSIYPVKLCVERYIL